MASTPPTARLRLYCQGIGDALLIDLPKTDGSRFRLLIDCGIHSLTPGGSALIRDVVADLATVTNRRLDAIAGTHEHWDHLSGFSSEAEQWRQFQIDAVWMSWAEDPDDEIARQLDRYKGDAIAAIAGMRQHIGFGAGAAAVDALMGFQFGAAGERVREAREALRSLAPGGKAQIFRPGQRIDGLSLDGFDIWVLGPPRDRAMLKLHTDPDREYHFGAAPGSDGMAAAVNALAIADGRMTAAQDPCAPFDGDAGVPLSRLLAGHWSGLAPAGAQLLWDNYFQATTPEGKPDPLATRRRIDGEWLGAGVDFGLQLDKLTNNTSLVLAIENKTSGHVMLFAADAQAGAWKSWETLMVGTARKKRPAEALLKRTIFYKAGHHGSQNGTSRDWVERMDLANLMVFVPVDEVVARTKCRWLDFPAAKVMARLQSATQGRVISADAAWLRQPAGTADPLTSWQSAALVAARHGMAGAVPWVELELC